jgi:hypothetical protein
MIKPSRFVVSTSISVATPVAFDATSATSVETTTSPSPSRLLGSSPLVSQPRTLSRSSHIISITASGGKMQAFKTLRNAYASMKTAVTDDIG